VHLLNKYGGWRAQDELWSYFDDGVVDIHMSSRGERGRIRVLMETSRSTPMDLADAALVAAAESLGASRIFTFDADFYVYRIDGTKSFDVIP